MKQSITFCQFTDSFRDHGRDNFSYDGMKALYDWIEDMDDQCETETELDVIALCCEFTEYSDLAEFQADYSNDYDSIDAIQDRTIVIPVSAESFIVQAF